MEVRPPNSGEASYLGSGAGGSSQPLVLVALLTAFFALVVWQGSPKTAGSTPEVQTADSDGAQFETGTSVVDAH
jgi:hypothetical protein